MRPLRPQGTAFPAPPPPLPAGPDPRPTLAAYGAPFLLPPARELPLEEAVARSLLLLRSDPRVLYCLPVLLERHAGSLDVDLLKRRAGDLDAAAELGMVLDLTAELAGSEQLRAWASDLPPVDGAPQYLDTGSSDAARAFSETQTPPVLARWGFRANAPLDDLRAFFEKHRAARG